MVRRRAHDPLQVYLNNRLVGHLRKDSGGAIRFVYDAAWLAWDHRLPISLSLPLTEETYRGARVEAVFDNLLPDSPVLRRRVAERVGARGPDVYSLLEAIGRDCVGALQILTEVAAADIMTGPAGVVRGVAIDEDAIADILRNLARTPLGLGGEDDFRLSIAGAQEKTAFLYRDGRWHKSLGTTATTHILKPQIGRLSNGIDLSNSVENEFYCLRLLGAFGLAVAEARIETFGDVRALVLTRFDRRWTRDGRLLRLPQEDCCQALGVPSTLKYQNQGGPGLTDLIRLLKGSDRPLDDPLTVFKAQVLFWLIGATDGHAKNFSVFLTPGGRYALTPLYDVLTAQPSLDDGTIQKKAMKLAMAVGDRNHDRIDDITGRHFLQTAARSGIPLPAARAVLTEIAEGSEQALADTEAGLPTEFPASIPDSVTRAVRARRNRLIVP
ncbi:type II toxin-antitoxin system HipA family toxin [Rhodospira trueperi]|uniref:Serine/threonine-protein kinase HipA n=1 Tax=Rhodospira trueperi TaxID=69960 RepID=A0A1G7HND9_9PROT|nr:type II toxin-antitoxin system HipA family toxin [Rhodospira trueperi]SDF01913.1 serine/threonine-protein kinase HipA [Rhodospira trueperi]